MTHPVAPYLIAIAIGDLAFREIGPRTGVYTEPSVLDAAASEFADLEKMVTEAEALYGPYRWGRYDLLVLPPSFPFGGMENPRLTFATPTVIAGDKSLVSLVAHELAHSWSGTPRDQRHLGGFLAQRRVHRLLREPHHGARLQQALRGHAGPTSAGTACNHRSRISADPRPRTRGCTSTWPAAIPMTA